MSDRFAAHWPCSPASGFPPRAVTGERGRIARELRDVIGHSSLLSDPDCFGRLRAQRPPRWD
jgi:hypothetical protein